MEENTGGMQAMPLQNNQRIVTLFPRTRVADTHVAIYASTDDAITDLKPQKPVHCVREHSVQFMTKWFMNNFPGDVMYAVKTNPEPVVLDAAYQAGMRHFDVASLTEAELIHSRYDHAVMHFMHPVKSREAIAKAYYYYGIRHFSLDSHAELKKILEVTNNAKDLNLSVRLSISNDKAAMKLTGKFGVAVEDAALLLKAVQKVAAKTGLCFHVGSQCMDPDAFTSTLKVVADLVRANGVVLDILDVGGGFPSVYPDKVPPKMIHFMDAINMALQTMPVSKQCQVLCEPGRALVAEAGSLLVRVELRKGAALYINDGVYGSLFDAGAPAFIYPTKAIRPQHQFDSELLPFMFYGPTCDSCDAMHGPFMLPADIAEGDWIEIGQMGAYGATMRTKFNGFYSDELIRVNDEPLLKMEME